MDALIYVVNGLLFLIYTLAEHFVAVLYPALGVVAYMMLETEANRATLQHERPPMTAAHVLTAVSTLSGVAVAMGHGAFPLLSGAMAVLALGAAWLMPAFRYQTLWRGYGNALGYNLAVLAWWAVTALEPNLTAPGLRYLAIMADVALWAILPLGHAVSMIGPALANPQVFAWKHPSETIHELRARGRR